MAGVAFAVEGDGVGFATESYAASALYTTLASLSGALWRIRRANLSVLSAPVLTADVPEPSTWAMLLLGFAQHGRCCCSASLASASWRIVGSHSQHCVQPDPRSSDLNLRAAYGRLLF